MKKPAAEPPLFVPLRKEWYLAFAGGQKNTEYRAYGPRWNEKTCRVGRRAVLAYGYGWPRISTVIASFTILDRADAPAAARDIFPDARKIAAIKMVSGP